MSRLAVLALPAAVALAACGDRLVGRDYAGEPLAVLSGSLVPTPETEVTGAVRLALAWYPQWMAAEDPSAGAASAVAPEKHKTRHPLQGDGPRMIALDDLVPGPGIEPGTRGFSVPCSTS